MGGDEHGRRVTTNEYSRVEFLGRSGYAAYAIVSKNISLLYCAQSSSHKCTTSSVRNTDKEKGMSGTHVVEIFRSVDPWVPYRR